MTERSRAVRVAVPLLLFLASATMLFLRLDEPSRIVFDETYYVDDARDFLEHGVESTFAVHPPVGKWMIAAGIKVFGDEAFGWRASGALVGAGIVLLTYLMALRLLRHRGYASFAALMVATDGLFFVQARTSMLDIHLAFFVALGAWLLLVDYDTARMDARPDPPPQPTAVPAVAAAPAAANADDLAIPAGGSNDHPVGPVTGRGHDVAIPAGGSNDHPVAPAPAAVTLEPQPPRRGHGYRWLAGVAFGLAAATKWSAALALAAAVLLSLGWEVARARGYGKVRLGPLVALAGIGGALGAVLGVIVSSAVGDGPTTLLVPAVLGAGAGAVLSLLIEAPLRRATAGILAALVLVPLGVYFVSYIPWLVNYPHTTEGKPDCKDTEGQILDPCPRSPVQRIEGLARYQVKIWEFHRDLEADHPYRAPAYTWPVLARPVVYYWESCPADRANRVAATDEDGAVTIPEPCVVDEGEAAEIIALGNPALWWGFIGAALVLVGGLVRRDRRAAFIAAFWGLQFLPWLFVSRPVFIFYMVPVVPFLGLGVAFAALWLGENHRVLGMYAGALLGAVVGFAAGIGVEAATDVSSAARWVALGAGWLAGAAVGALIDGRLERERGPRERPDPTWARKRSPGVWVAASLAVATVALFIYFYPVWIGLPLPDGAVRNRWWIRPGWI